LQEILIDEATNAVNDSVCYRALGKQAWDMYIKTCILMSLPKIDGAQHPQNGRDILSM